MRLLKVRLKTNEIVLMSLIVVTFFALFHFFWKSSTKVITLNNLRAKSEISKAALLENKNQIEKLSKRDPASEGLNADYMDKYLSFNDKFSSVITGIVNSSKGRGFSLTKLSLEDQSIENGYKKILYSIDAEATFIDIGKFLEKLEDAPLLTEVTSIEINRIDVEMKRCQAQIKLYSYVRSE